MNNLTDSSARLGLGYALCGYVYTFHSLLCSGEKINLGICRFPDGRLGETWILM
jgi:hypothetical protein